MLPTASVQEALRTLETHNLHTAPVLTVEGRLVGVISDADLRRATRRPALEAIDPAGCLHHSHQATHRVPDPPHEGSSSDEQACQTMPESRWWAE